MEIEELIKIAESDSWTVTEEEYTNGKGLLFSKYSPAGQDFSISTGPFESAEELINSIHQRYVEFDADSETYLWLAPTSTVTNAILIATTVSYTFVT